MGIDTSPDAGWLHNKGLRIIGGGMRLELPWPELASFPTYGLVRPRSDFDERPRPAGRRRPAPGCTSTPTSPARSSTSAAASPA